MAVGLGWAAADGYEFGSNSTAPQEENDLNLVGLLIFRKRVDF